MRKRISGVSVLFVLFFLFLCIQHQFVYLYFDDYGYASLTYGYTGNTAGMDYSILDVFGFIKWHYLEWGGRVLYYLLGILSMRAGLWCVRLAQCLYSGNQHILLAADRNGGGRERKFHKGIYHCISVWRCWHRNLSRGDFLVQRCHGLCVAALRSFCGGLLPETVSYEGKARPPGPVLCPVFCGGLLL